MILRYYESDIEIRKGDRVLFNGEPGEIELVVTERVGNPETDWYMQEDGGGVAILQPEPFGRTFIPADQLDTTEDLEFVARATEP